MQRQLLEAGAVDPPVKATTLGLKATKFKAHLEMFRLDPEHYRCNSKTFTKTFCM